MKIHFIYPQKFEGSEEKTLVKLSVTTNKRMVFDFECNEINWKIINCLNIKSLVLIAKHKRNYYWCNTIPFELIFKKYPILKSDSERFEKTGFQRKIIEAIFKQLKIKEKVNNINLEKLSQYIEGEYGRKN